MDFMFIIASSVMILICFYFIISPFFVKKGAWAGVKKEGGEQVSLDHLYKTVNELEMDYLMKKISEKDFYHLKEQYQALAAKIMKQEKSQKKSVLNRKEDKEVELEILEELKRIKAEKGR